MYVVYPFALERLGTQRGMVCTEGRTERSRSTRFANRVANQGIETRQHSHVGGLERLREAELGLETAGSGADRYAHRRWLAKLRRRSISIPAIGMALALWCITSPLWLVLFAVMDGLNPGWGRRPRLRAMCFFGLYFFCELIGILVAVSLWVLTLGGMLVGKARFLSAHYALQRWWSQALFRGSFGLFSMSIDVEGESVAREGPYVLFVRHSSSADTVLAAGVLANPQRRRFRYVLKQELLWDPCLDIVGCRLPNVFVNRRAARSGNQVLAVADLARHLGPDEGVLIYPEGTRFSPKKQARAVEKIRDKGWDELAEIAASYRSVLPPRVAGPLALIEAAPQLDVVVLEHSGFEGVDSFKRFWSGELIGRTVHVRLRRIPASEIPSSDRERWLFEQWLDTDRWITQVRSDSVAK